jgi:hypothetical protein
MVILSTVFVTSARDAVHRGRFRWQQPPQQTPRRLYILALV